MPSVLYWKYVCRNLKFNTNILKYTYYNKYCTIKLSDNENLAPDQSTSFSKQNKLSAIPEEPTTCCMSGCPDCVWLKYAEELCNYYLDGGEQAIKEINERISDPNIKAYLLHEIRMRNKK